MSASYGHLGEWEGGPVGQAIRSMQTTARAKGIASGIIARDAGDVVARRKQGFQMIGIGADVNLMMAGIRGALEAFNVSLSDAESLPDENGIALAAGQGFEQP
jgi:2-keto-3-deoxy-L-rhamnonate aldolase RhmA